MSDTMKGYMRADYTRQAGKITERESWLAAKQIETEATAREADRKERLARAMASTVATAGARGVSALEGSPLSILEQSVKAEEVATERDRYASELEKMTTIYRGRIAKMRAGSEAAWQEKEGRSGTFRKVFSIVSGVMGGGGMGNMGGSSTSSGGTGSGQSVGKMGSYQSQFTNRNM